MVFGALVGGLIRKAGERGYEASERKHSEDLYKQKIQLDFLTNDLQQNWDTYDENDRAVRYGMIEPLAGMKKGQLGQFASFGEQVYKILPPAPTQGTAPASTPRTQQAVAGETQPALQSAMSPAFRTRSGQQVEATTAPAMPEISIGQVPQIPTSAETVPSAAWAGPTQPGKTINYSQVPGERKLQMKQRFEENERQQMVGEIMNSSMAPEDKALAIKALHIPGGVLAAQERAMGGGGAPNVGLNTIEFVSPNGKRVITAQPTRTGELVETGTGRVIHPAAIQGWTKRHVMSPYMFTTPQGTVGTVNKEEIARQGLGTITGEIPDAQVAETKTPLVNPTTGVVSGEWGSRSGLGGMTGNGTTSELAKSPRSKTELDARTYLTTALSQVEQIQEISKRRPDLIGQLDYLKEGGKRFLGFQGDEDANNLYNALDRFKEDLIRAKEGAVIPPAMIARLEKLVSGRAWTNEAQFADDMANAAEVLRLSRTGRGMDTPTTITGREGNRSRTGKGGGGLSVTAPNGKTYTFPTKDAADKFRAATGAK